MVSNNLLLISLWTALISITFSFASSPLQLDFVTSQGDDEYFHQSILNKDKVGPTPRYRLPQTVEPIHYNLDIIPILNFGTDNELDYFTAPGNVSILVKCLVSTQTIVLHSHSETTHEEGGISVTSESNGADIAVVDFFFNSDQQSLTILLGDTGLQVGQNYTIKISFVATINNNDDGLYQSYYTTDDGNTRYIATTQFESIGARRCFPCFDEPALRATFDIKIGRFNDSVYHTLSNTETIETNEPIDGWTGWVWDTHNTTVNMPTYLIAIIVSDFDYKEAPAELYRYPVKTWAPPNQITDETGNYSSYIQAKLLTFFEDYFESDYQLTKMDSVAVEVFAAGAMENWGLNTYRVPYMLFIEGESTQFEKWRAAAVISHELSHQWFGNLMTINWWNDLWLKEGFARYMQFIGVEGTDPELQAMNRVVLDCIQIAMENDISASTHAINRPITDVLPYNNARIIYEKGASLIRMMQGFLTEETLIAGLRIFLEKFSYSSAVTSELFDVLTEQAHLDGTLSPHITIYDIMESWTDRVGFPLVRVSRAGSSRLFVSQEQFYPLNQPPTTSKDLDPNDLWEVPVTYATATNPDFTSSNWQPKFWIPKTMSLINIEFTNTSQWIIFNPDARSYYRVLYDDYLHGLIKRQLDTDYTVISLSSRSQLLDDYLASAYNNYIGIQSALELTTYMDQEEELIPWTTFLNRMRRPYTLLSEQEAELYDSFKSYVLSKVTAQLPDSIVEPGLGDPVAIMQHAQLLDWACSMNVSFCSEPARGLVDEWRMDPDNNPISADIQPVIYCAAIAGSDAGDVVIQDFFIQRYNNESTSTKQRGLLLNALACHTNPSALESTLNMTLDDEPRINSTTDRRTLIQRVADNRIGRDLAIQFLIDRKVELNETLGESVFSNVISTLSTYVSTAEKLSTLEAFFSANENDFSESVKSSIRNSFTAIRANLAWVETHSSGINDFLQSNLPK